MRMMMMWPPLAQQRRRLGRTPPSGAPCTCTCTCAPRACACRYVQDYKEDDPRTHKGYDLHRMTMAELYKKVRRGHVCACTAQHNAGGAARPSACLAGATMP